MSIRAALTKTSTDVLTTVSASTSMVTHGAQSLAYLTESGSLRAKAFLDATKDEITENAHHRKLVRVNTGKADVAQQLLSLQARLEADDALFDIFDQLTGEDETFTFRRKAPTAPAKLHAAE